MKKIVFLLFFVFAAYSCFAAKIIMKSGEVYEVDSVDVGYSSTQVSAVKDKNKIVLNKSEISSYEDMVPAPHMISSENTKQLKKEAEKANALKSEKPKSASAEDIKATPEKENKAEKTSKKVRENSTAQNTRSNAFSVSPFKSELSLRLWPSEDTGLDITFGMDITPDNYIVEDTIDDYAEGQEYRAGIFIVAPAIETGTVNLNVLPGFMFGFKRSVWDDFPGYASVNLKFSLVCNFEVEWFPLMLGKNLSLCSSAGLGIQLNSSANYNGVKLQEPWVNSLIVRVASDFVINPVYLRYYF